LDSSESTELVSFTDTIQGVVFLRFVNNYFPFEFLLIYPYLLLFLSEMIEKTQYVILFYQFKLRFELRYGIWKIITLVPISLYIVLLQLSSAIHFA